MPSLSEQVQGNAEAARILEGPSSNQEAALALFSLGVITSDRSVSRWRERYVKDSVGKMTTTPKDMPTYAEEKGTEGSAALHLPRPGATETDLLREAGFDPESWRIKGSVNTRRWMRYDQEWLFYYKFDVEQGEGERSRQAHIDELVREIRKRPARPIKFFNLDHDHTYTVILSDWQIGKSEGGKGSADTLARWKQALDQIEDDIKRLQKFMCLETLALLSVGDLVEGCGDHYDMQTFLVDLDRRNQNKLVREMITMTILRLAKYFVQVKVAGIGGNHGENRRKGKAYTTFADNDDVACIEAVRESFDLADWTDIEWIIPDDELSINVELSGVNVGLVHGHQFRGGANAWKKMEDWWRGNDFGLQAIQKSQILVSGHFHFEAEVNVSANRVWFQAPTIDPGSKWYTDISGNTSIPGVLTMVVGEEFPLGYDYKRIIHPRDLEQVS